MAMSRNEILDHLRSHEARHRSILAVGAGNGLVARCAEAGGGWDDERRLCYLAVPGPFVPPAMIG